MKYAPLLWCKLAVRGDLVPVYLSCSKLSQCLTECMGMTTLSDNGKLVIFIDAAESRAAQDETLTHELVHACLWGNKLLHWKTEEWVAETIASRSSGILVWPKRPKGIRALERYARK